MSDLGYEASLKAHYAEVFARLGHTAAPPRLSRAAIREEERMDAVERVWPEVAAEPEPEEPLIPQPLYWRQIVREVCEKHGVSLTEIVGNRRAKDIVAARHEAFWRLSRETLMSLPRIGYRMGGKHHTTVLHGIRKHELKMTQAGQLSPQSTRPGKESPVLVER